MHRIEWPTMLFFAAVFVTMECLARLGLMKWIGKQSEIIIQSVEEDYRLAVAIIIILWVSLCESRIPISFKATTSPILGFSTDIITRG